MVSPSAVPNSPADSPGPRDSPNKARRAVASKVIPTRKSVATPMKMDGAKMSELATIKLKQMDGLTKKMKENYKRCHEQIEKGECGGGVW